MRARVWLAVAAVLLTVVGITAARTWSSHDSPSSAAHVSSQTTGANPSDSPSTASQQPPSPPPPPPPPPPWHPGSVLGDKFLVAYYGTPGTSSLGVLGATDVQQMTSRLEAAAQPWAVASGRPVQIVYEIIATVADSYAGADGTYSHDIDRSVIEPYLRAARTNGALVVLDLQPGRSDFLTVAKRWAWALKEPNVGLALDPEWRMHGDDVPGQVFGYVTGQEVDQTADWLAALTKKDRLPQKIFLIHQFVPSMIADVAAIHPVRGLAMVQHVDGWGGRQDKLATFHNVARPKQFTMGFKLFYKEDIDMFTATQLLQALPNVRYVSYQ